MAQLLIKNLDGVTVVHFQHTTVLDQNVVDEVGRELKAIIDQTVTKKVLLNLGRIELMTSSMIGEFVKFKKKCDDNQMDLGLCDLSADLTKLFKMTRLNKVFKIYATQEKGIKAMA